MAIHCPYCQQTMELKGAKAGRYSPKCTACHGKFSLTIPEGENAAPFVKAIPGEEPQANAIEDALGIEHAKPAPPKKAAVTQAPVKRQVSTPSPGTPGEGGATVAPSRATVAPPQSHAPIAPANVTAAPAPAKPQAAVSLPPAPPADAPQPEIELSGSLGGYEVKQKLGQGGMGAVFLARQVSLDRNVALKVLSPKLAEDPQFIARFTREAYAAAQLSHHNVVQIHDIGYDRNLNFFSMEFVEGNTLSGVVEASGKLDPQLAAGYILQAARGLKFAHDHGMVHRDVKPDNLLLNDDGIVKVADLGLVKRADTAEPKTNGSANVDDISPTQTQLNISMGTPAYMPPEQATDAAHVDQRADIYSLGCTFYDLLTGRPPFVAHSAVEVITMHASQAVTPPDRVAKHVPAVLSAVVMKMTAKQPIERYQNMGEVITALEDFLGVDSRKAFSPKEEHVKVLEFAVQRFNSSKFANLRGWMIRGFFALTLLAVVICALQMVGYPLIAGGLVGFAVLTTLVYQITAGVTQRTAVFKKFRELIFGAGIVDWLKYLILLVAAGAALYAFNLHLVWLGFGVLAACVAMGFYFSIDLLANKERATPVQQVDTMLKQMRLRGLDENAIRHFVSRYSGDKWEEFYESLFGYEAKIQARRMWGKNDKGRDRKKHAAWRDSFIAWVDHKQQLRKERREQKLLAKLEAKVLRSKGVDQRLADKQAKKSAERMVGKAAHLKETAFNHASVTALPTAAATQLPHIAVIKPGFMSDDHPADEKEHAKHESYLKRRYGSPLDMVFGKQIRFAAAVLLLAGFAMWWNVNGGWEVKKALADMQASSENPADIAAKKVITTAKEQIKTTQLQAKRAMEPLRIRMVPDRITDVVGSWNGGVAGAVLVVSLIFTGKLLGLTVLLGAAITLIGHKLGLPILAEQAWLAGVIGCALAGVGMFFFRPRVGF